MTCPDCGTTNPAGMRFCGMCGSPLGPQLIGRERRRVSTLFIDLASFSSLTRDLDPEELRDLANEVLTVVAGVIENYDGFVDAFRGDGLIALFGAPHSHPDDPLRAVRAAAAGLRAIEAIGRGRGYPLHGRAGVTTGTVIAGSVGSGRVRDYTVMGSSVNLAARLEAAAEPGEVWVGPETYEVTHHALRYASTGPVDLAGFPNVREAFRLVGDDERADDDPYRGLAFVGRRREMRLLDEAMQRVRERGRAHELWLLGETGSGKTRLLREFERSLGERARVFWIHPKPAETFAWGPLARQVFDVHEEQERSLRKQRVSEQLELLLPGEPRWHRTILSSLDLIPYKEWTRLERRSVDRTNLAWRDLLAGLARTAETPVVVIVEDEPSDAGLLEFLMLVAQADAPLLLLRSGRGRERAVDEGSGFVALQPLDRDESRTLLDQLASPILQVATDALVEQVGGVPAYILELGRALSITQEGSFSGSLASLLQARLDMVEPAARRLLAHAALSGERCWEGLMVVLADGHGERHLRTLVDEKLLVQQGNSSLHGEAEFRFQSELLRRAVLRMIPFGDRPILHLKIASWLEQRAPLTFSEAIARHFRQGGSDDAAYGHYLAAADLALSGGEHERVRAIYETITTLSVSAEEQAQAALAYAQSALRMDDAALVTAQLTRVHELLAACAPETCEKLGEVAAQLAREVAGRRGRPGG